MYYIVSTQLSSRLAASYDIACIIFCHGLHCTIYEAPAI
jgi:hypothetical protein